MNQNTNKCGSYGDQMWGTKCPYGVRMGTDSVFMFGILNNCKSGVNRHLQFYPFPKNLEMCRLCVRIIHLTLTHTRHISELKYSATHGTFPIFGEMDKTEVPIHSRSTII